LELPTKRRSYLKAFFVGLKPMRPAAYAGLLRAMARATIESGLVPVRKDAQHDPVELIAAAIEVCVDRWDRHGPRSTPQRHDFWKDLVARVVAFEALFGLRAGDERQHGALLAVVRAIEGDNAARTLDSLVDVFDRARIAVAVFAKSRPEHSEAMLAEIVVAGVGSSASACTAAWIPNALGCVSHPDHAATRTDFRSGRSVSAMASPHRSLVASARSWMM